MTLPVFWAPDLGDRATGDVVRLAGDEGRHAVVVRRIRVGERLVLTDGAGRRATCDVVATGRSDLDATVVSTSVEERPRPTVTVVQAIPKGDRGELAVEVLTEVGADRIVPWAAARSVAVWRGDRVAKSLAKWRTTAREAAKQSRRAWFPDVADLADTAQVAALLAAADHALVLHEDAGTALLDALPSVLDGDLVIVVGPEGGLDPDEVAAFGDAPGVRSVHLGPTVLRTSTAGLAAVAAVLAPTSRWRHPSSG